MKKNTILWICLFCLSISIIQAQTKKKPENTKAKVVINHDSISEIKQETSIPIWEEAKIETEPDKNPVYMVVEQNAIFNQKSISEFIDWVNKNHKYPEVALKNGISGKVYVQFIVDTTGKVTTIKVLRGIDRALDWEAVRTITTSPLWTPAKQGGKKVRQQFTIPVSFVLPEK